MFSYSDVLQQTHRSLRSIKINTLNYRQKDLIQLINIFLSY